jgi:hypothetical protein
MQLNFSSNGVLTDKVQLNTDLLKLWHRYLYRNGCVIKMVNEIKSVIKKGEVFNKSGCWVFMAAEEVIQWNIFLTDFKFVIKSTK